MIIHASWYPIRHGVSHGFGSCAEDKGSLEQKWAAKAPLLLTLLQPPVRDCCMLYAASMHMSRAPHVSHHCSRFGPFRLSRETDQSIPAALSKGHGAGRVDPRCDGGAQRSGCACAAAARARHVGGGQRGARSVDRLCSRALRCIMLHRALQQTRLRVVGSSQWAEAETNCVLRRRAALHAASRLT